MTSRAFGFLALASLLAAPQAFAYPPDANFDEAKVAAYTLPDPLIGTDGKPISTARAWQKRRRREILQLFEREMYGRTPAAKGIRFEVLEKPTPALDGVALRRRVAVYLAPGADAPRLHLLVYQPANQRGPVPVFLVPSLSALYKIHKDPALPLDREWDRKLKITVPADPSKRGSSTYWDVEKVLARGYALATFYYCDAEPDFVGGIVHGVRPRYYAAGQTEPAPGDWGAIGAWAFGLSRAADYLVSDRTFDKKRIVLMGHSRLGKTALWAGAQDPRFAVVIANGSGEGGAALSRRGYGETVRDLTKNFPHQFTSSYQRYSGHADELPFDQHFLLALIAPRPLYLGAAVEDQWADPKGELMAARAAEPVFFLFDKTGLGLSELPSLGTFVMNDLGFHYRSGKHEVTAYDWDRFLDFADLHLPRKGSVKADDTSPERRRQMRRAVVEASPQSDGEP